MILSKNVFVRGTFLRKNIADAVGATSCRPVRRNGVIKFRIIVCTQKFCSHADFTEFTEAHWLRVLALRDVCATICAGGCRGRTLCRPVVNLRTIAPICVRVIFYFHTEFTEFTEAHVLRVLAMRGVCSMKCVEGCRGRTLCRPVVNLRTIAPIRVGTSYNLRTIASIRVGTSYNLRTITPIRIYVKYKLIFAISKSQATA